MANPTWFDTAHYKAQKLAQLQATDTNGAWTPTKLDEVLAANGFAGAEGAFAHFTAYGSDEHCTPNAAFNAAEYLAAKLVQLEKTDNLWVGKTLNDVQAALAKAGLGEWEHYQLYGSKEGVNPSNAFDESAYYDAKLAQLIATDATNWTGKNAIDVRDALQAAGLSALEHFLMFGKGENLAAPAVPADEQVTVPSGFYIFGGQGGMPSVGLELTRGTDNLTGTAGNDSFFAANANGFPTLNPSDTLNGGTGDDTLFIGKDAGLVNFAAASIKGIENVVAYGSVDVSANADVQNLTVMAGGEGTAKMAQNVTLQDAAHNYALAAKFVDATGKEDAVTVNVKNNTDMPGLIVNSIEKLTLNLTGKNVDNVDNRDAAADFAANGLQELIVTGEGSVKLTDSQGASGDVGSVGTTGTIKSLDFSANKGGVALDLNYDNLNTKAVSVKGGVGDDDVTNAKSTAGTTAGIKFDVDMGAGNDTFEIITNVKKDSVITGGDGTDTLVLNKVLMTEDSTLGKMISNFEDVTIKGDSTYVAGIIKGIGDVTVIGSTNNVTITDLGSVTVAGGTISKLDMNSTVVDITFDNGREGLTAADGVAITNLNLTDSGILRIHSEGYVATTNELTIKDITATAATLTSVVIDGDQDLTITGFASAVASALGTIDARTLTGDLTVTLTEDFSGSAQVRHNVEVFGGSGDDKIHTSANSQLAELTGGAGNDTFDVALTTTGAAGNTPGTGAAGMVIIKDFEKGDTIDVGAPNTVTKIDGLGTFAGFSAQLDILTTASGGSAVASWFTDGNNSYIVFNPNSASTATDDVVVKLSGISDLKGINIDAGVISWA